ncbi:MAG: diacylglycerol O-acyltransferase / wax synthase [Actinomycetota bacterium]|nr:diacylglycerol O-acyltransferase / wax synthase [Actinomycetota bacterium]
MADRLSPLDVSFLYFEEPTTPMHVGGVAVFQAPEDGFDYDRLVGLINDRIAFVPRYRQRIRWVPGRLANPVWVDDENFDINYHVRRSALPPPGTDAQLRDFVARVQSRPLDRSRPLWETYLVEGLSDDRFAIITKTHHAMVDGVGAVDIGQVILDTSPEPADTPEDTWRPAPEPSWIELVAGAVAETVRRPTAVVDTVRGGLSDVRSTAERLAGAVGGLFAAAATAARPAPGSPLNATIGEQRRYATVTLDLDDHRRVRKTHGGTVNDVVLATVAGALRSWLLMRGEPVTSSTTVRAMVPVSIRSDEENGHMGNRVASYLVDLPVGEPSAAMRLHQVSYRMRAHKETGQAVGAEALAGLAGFAPPTLHALGARLASGLSKRWFNLVVTNVPGPQVPLYAASARMLAAFPVVPLAKGQAVSIGLTSYDGKVFYGLNADRDAMPDVEVLAQCIEDALAELVETVR